MNNAQLMRELKESEEIKQVINHLTQDIIDLYHIQIISRYQFRILMKQLRCLAVAWKKIEKNTVNIAILSAKREILLQFIFPHIINLNGEK